MRALAVIVVVALVGCNNNSDKQRLPIGNACTTSGQCGTGKYFCDTAFPNGYCKADCHADGDCPTGSVCVGAGMILLGECEKSCASDGDCRVGEGYLCNLGADEASGAYCDAPTPDDGGVTGDGGS